MMCPRCDSSDRERLVYLYLKRETLQNHARLLHVAPERNLQRVLLSQRNIEYLSADLNSPLAAVTMDIQCIGFEAEIFDGLICNHVLEHVPDDRQAISELLRILKPGGWAILQVPIAAALRETIEDPTVESPEERRRRFGERGHVRIYGRDYARRLEGAGFVVNRWCALREYGRPFVDTYGLNPEEILYACRKPERRIRRTVARTPATVT